MRSTARQCPPSPTPSCSRPPNSWLLPAKPPRNTRTFVRLRPTDTMPLVPTCLAWVFTTVRQGAARSFSIDEPPILLYEKDPTSPSLRLVGVSYLLVAPSGADGQPATSPFPRALASWHKHNNVCVLPDNSASVDLTEAQCTGRGGRFTAETSWMVHAWIWKDSPAGVFSPTNPSVK